jgi:hypothetical protein
VKRISHFLAIYRLSILPLTAAILATAIFILDTVTDLEIAAAVFYVVVVLMSVSFCQMRGVLLVRGVHSTNSLQFFPNSRRLAGSRFDQLCDQRIGDCSNNLSCPENRFC